MESIGKRLKRIRIEAGISQQEMASLVKVRRETIGHWEREDNLPRELCKDKLNEILNNLETFVDMSDKL